VMNRAPMKLILVLDGKSSTPSLLEFV